MKDKCRILILTWCIVCDGVKAVEKNSFNCTFDDGLCNWESVMNNEFKLVWGRQNTSTSNTGPDSDHTSGVGNFIYINSSNELTNKRARLKSIGWNSPGNYCLSFWFYMYGRDTDRLWIAVEKEGLSKLKGIFFKSKDQRKIWRFRKKVFTTENNFKIIIQGTIRNDINDSGYIAVDDVKMFHEECPKYCSDPTPAFGTAVVGDIWKGSTKIIECREWYVVKGNSSIVCQDNGKWSDTPSCLPVDCSDPTPISGDVISTDFKVGSVVQVTCATGFKLVGTPQIVCLINSTWSDNPVCKRIECSKPILTTGLLEPNGTTWYPNQFILLACADGNTLRGNAKITCQESGNWTILPTCDYNEESFSGDLIAVAVTVPIIAICILVIITVAFCRKRTFWCMEGDKTSEQNMNRQNQLPQNTYGNSGINTDSCPADESLGLDTVYAVISKKNPPELKDDDFYNTVKYGTNVTNKCRL